MTEAMEHAKTQLARISLDNCVKCTTCETVCPVAEVTDLFPGPKYVGPQAERFREGQSVDRSLDYCSSCSICTLNCPQGVQIAEINSQARAVMKADHMPLRDRLVSNTSLMGRLMTPFAPMANAALANKLIRKLVEKIIGIHRDAPMPTAHFQTFTGWWRKHQAPTTPRTHGSIVFFHGCAGGYFEVETSIKSVEVLEHLGFDVIVPKQGCCGLAQQSNGLFEDATKAVIKLSEQLSATGKQLTVISASGSCTGMLKHEAHEIMGVSDPALLSVGTRIRDISEFLIELYEADQLPVEQFNRNDIVVPYHAPCQLKSQGMGMPAITLMELIPGVKVIESGRACCGMAGSYGVKKEKYDIAQAIGKPLFEFVRKTNQGITVCDTETCRWQIEKGSGVKTVHPIWLVHKAFGLS